jgi:hypothetical protein
MALSRDKLKRVEREVAKDVVLVRGRDGRIKGFDRTHALGQLYLARLAAALGGPRPSGEFLDARADAAPESRRAVERMDSGPWYDDLSAEAAKPAVPPEDLSEQP